MKFVKDLIQSSICLPSYFVPMLFHAALRSVWKGLKFGQQCQLNSKLTKEVGVRGGEKEEEEAEATNLCNLAP
jgi:hypothetical protein